MEWKALCYDREEIQPGTPTAEWKALSYNREEFQPVTQLGFQLLGEWKALCYNDNQKEFQPVTQLGTWDSNCRMESIAL